MGAPVGGGQTQVFEARIAAPDVADAHGAFVSHVEPRREQLPARNGLRSAPSLATSQPALCEGGSCSSTPAATDPKAPWDPDKKPKWIDTTYFWVLLPVLIVFILVFVFVAN
jgi:hypothetical protein